MAAEFVNPPEQGNPDRVTESVDQIPDNLQGKSSAELADMYQQLERKLGQQSEELGQLRRLADQQVTMPTQEPEEIDFYSDPEKAVERIIERKLGPVSSAVTQQQVKETERLLDSNHAGWRDTVQDKAFSEWVGKSKARMNLWQSADHGDYDSASELLGWWSDLNGQKQAAQVTAEKAVEKDRQVRRATTEKGGAKIDGRRVLSRADLQELRRTNPDRYNALLPDIRKAYSEGRVR